MAVYDLLFGLLHKKVKKGAELNSMKKQEEEAEREESFYDFYKRIERQTRVNRSFLQVEERANMLNWLTRVQEGFRMTPDTLFLAVNIVDRFFSQDSVPRSEMKLVGTAALCIAYKYEDGYSLSAREFDKFLLNYRKYEDEIIYSQEEIDSMEVKILRRLDWRLMVPTIHTFLLQFLSACGDIDPLFKNLAFCFGELAMNDYSTTIWYSPSLIAISAVYAAETCMQSNIHGWDKALESGYSKRQIEPCARKLLQLAKLKSNRKVVEKYFNDKTRAAIALAIKRSW